METTSPVYTESFPVHSWADVTLSKSAVARIRRAIHTVSIKRRASKEKNLESEAGFYFGNSRISTNLFANKMLNVESRETWVQ
jgi:hypothetical protein